MEDRKESGGGLGWSLGPRTGDYSKGLTRGVSFSSHETWGRSFSCAFVALS